jgi:hypothetical protein
MSFLIYEKDGPVVTLYAYEEGRVIEAFARA